MFSKVAIIFATLAAVHASGIVGYGAPLLGAGHLGLVSAQNTAINLVAPATRLGYGGHLTYGHGFAAAPYAYGLVAPLAYGHGLGSGPLGYGHGLGAGHLGYGHRLAAGPLGYGHGVVGAGYAGSLGLGHRLGLGKAYL